MYESHVQALLSIVNLAYGTAVYIYSD